MRRTSILALGACLVIGAVGAGCSSNSTTSTGTSSAPTTTAASSGGGSSTTTSGGTSGTTGGTTGGGKAPTITKPATVEKVDKSKLPAKAQAADQISGLTTDQQDCIDYTIYQTITGDPTLAENELSLAGVIGGTLVACVPQQTLATGFTALIKASTPSLTDAQTSCVEQQFTSADAQSLAIFIGAYVIQDPTLGKAYAAAFDQACGTTFASS